MSFNHILDLIAVFLFLIKVCRRTISGHKHLTCCAGGVVCVDNFNLACWLRPTRPSIATLNPARITLGRAWGPAPPPPPPPTGCFGDVFPKQLSYRRSEGKPRTIRLASCTKFCADRSCTSRANPGYREFVPL